MSCGLVVISDQNGYITAVSLHIRGEGENNQDGGSDQEIKEIRQGYHVWGGSLPHSDES